MIDCLIQKKNVFLLQVLLLAVSWTLSLCLSCMSSPMVSPPTPSSSHILPHHSLPQNFLQRPKPASIERHKLRLEDIRHRLSAAALQKVEIETNRLRKSRRSRRPGKLPTTSCMMTTRSLVERRGICEPRRRLCGVDGTYFHDYVSWHRTLLKRLVQPFLAGPDTPLRDNVSKP